MSQMVLSNETVLIEQHANDRGPGRGGDQGAKPPPPEAETRLAFGRSVEAANTPAF